MLQHALWRRLDTPGHDAATLRRVDTGWRLEGTAVFVHDGRPASLRYELGLHASWETREATIRGFLGATTVDVAITRGAAGWTFNGAPVAGLDHLVDLDLGFTPATNLPQLRRLNLAPGGDAALAVAWLDAGADTLVELSQHYRCRDALTFAYDAPSVPYHEVLDLSPSGFVRVYPGLWELECD